jgi:hypothetical protein
MNISQGEHGGNGESVMVVNHSLRLAGGRRFTGQAVVPVAQNHHPYLKFQASTDSF